MRYTSGWSRHRFFQILVFCKVLWWLTTNETIREKESFSFFLIEKEALKVFFCSVIKVTFMLKKWKLELFALRNTFSMVQIDNRALFERYCSCFSRLNEDSGNKSQRKRLMIDTNLSRQSLIVKQSMSKKKNLSFDFFRSFHHSAAACVGCAR